METTETRWKQISFKQLEVGQCIIITKYTGEVRNYILAKVISKTEINKINKVEINEISECPYDHINMDSIENMFILDGTNKKKILFQNRDNIQVKNSGSIDISIVNIYLLDTKDTNIVKEMAKKQIEEMEEKIKKLQEGKEFLKKL